MTDPAAILDCLVARSGRLYSLPTVAMKVLELTSDPEVDTAALKECIENDPALTTKLLRVVNSSLFGLSREVSDLNQALALLGTKPLKLLVLGFSLPSGLFAGVAGDVLGQYWRHALTKAVAAREISESLWHQPGDEAFIAGLLQDLGTLLLIQELGEPCVKFLKKAFAAGADLLALETESMGFDHTVLSSRLLAEWGLPETLVEAVCSQAIHQPPHTSAFSSPLSEILHLAELTAQLLADGRSEVLGELLDVGQWDHGLSRQQLEALVERLEETVRQLADVFSLQLPGGLDYRDVLMQAHRQLAEVAAEAVEDLLDSGHSGITAESEADGLFDEIQSLSEAIAGVTAGVGGRAGPQPAGWPATDSPAAEPPDATAGSSPRAFPPGPRALPETGPAAMEGDPGLLGQLAAAVAASRQSGCSLSLLLAELDDVPDLEMTFGVEGFDKLRSFLETVCRSVDHPSTICLPHREAGFALILPDCDRQPAVQSGKQLIDRVHRLTSDRSAKGRPAVRISVGVATVSRVPNKFPAKELLDGAARCLYGSHASGGGVAKSIEIY